MPVFDANGDSLSGFAINSWEFLLFAILAVIAMNLLGKATARNITLLAFNIYFISAFFVNVETVGILVSFIVLTYFIGRWRLRAEASRASAILGVSVVGLWAFLFLVRDGSLFSSVNPFYYVTVQIIGISYMVFRSISYLMEVEFIEEPGLLRYCNYILFFPLILAGPIERYRRFETQMTQPQWNPDLVMPALHRIANGMIKKFVIADNLSVFGILAFDNPMDMSVPVLWLGVMSQLLLIYLDFSGYCDIVIGLAMLMGFRVVENFNRPFHSTNIQEFWERWHMSLSSLVKDYIFTPINVYVFKNVRRQYQFALVVASYFFSMVLIAMWHGTTVGFLVFGILHGGALALSQAYKKIFKASAAAGQGPNVATVYAKRLMVYSFVSVSLTLWLTSASEWGGIFGRMLGFR